MLHATCVVFEGRGILLRGPSGSGKSDLALRLIDGGAVLVADDVVAVRASEGKLVASFPAAPSYLQGALEVRGLGIVQVPWQVEAVIELCIDLPLPVGEAERLSAQRLDFPVRGYSRDDSPSPTFLSHAAKESASPTGRGDFGERLPALSTVTIAGVEIRSLTLNPFEASAPAKIRAALKWDRVSA